MQSANPVLRAIHTRGAHDQGAAMEQAQEMAMQSISDYQKGWNDAALGRSPSDDMKHNHAYNMGRADRGSYRATR